MSANEEQKREAIRRLEVLVGMGLMPEVLEAFFEGRLAQSKEVRITPHFPVGVLYAVDGEREELIRQVERERGCMAYHAIVTDSPVGTMVSILSVSDDDKTWGYEAAYLEQGYTRCYVANLDHPEYSEWGAISFIAAQGGLIRTA